MQTELGESFLLVKWVWLRIKQEGQTAGFSPCFHLPGQPILEFRFCEPQPNVPQRRRVRKDPWLGPRVPLGSLRSLWENRALDVIGPQFDWSTLKEARFEGDLQFSLNVSNLQCIVWVSGRQFFVNLECFPAIL